MVKFGVIKSESYNSSNFNSVLNFTEVTCNSVKYMMCKAFFQYIEEDLFTYTFDSYKGYTAWLESGVDTTIIKVSYDWENELAYITISDTNFPGPYEFECTEEWTSEECQAAINEKFGIE
jgi:hypothetical protein